MTDDGRLSTELMYDAIITQQLQISYYCNGISITDTDNLSPYDRNLIFKKIIEFKEAEKELYQHSN